MKKKILVGLALAGIAGVGYAIAHTLNQAIGEDESEDEDGCDNGCEKCDGCENAKPGEKKSGKTKNEEFLNKIFDATAMELGYADYADMVKKGGKIVQDNDTDKYHVELPDFVVILPC